MLLFDTGSSESICYGIRKAIKSITDQPVRWVVNSHSHADHWLGNAAFNDPAVQIFASNQASELMKEYGEEDVAFYSHVTESTIGSTQVVYPTSLLDYEQKRIFGGVEVEFIFSSDAHSPGDLLMWLPKQQIIFGGDVLSSDWMPMITSHGNIPSLINTLQIIAKLNPTIVLTGHGNATSINSVIRDVDLLSSAWKQVVSDHKNVKTPDEIISDIKAKLGPKYTALYKDFVLEIERHVKLMYSLQP